MQTRNMMSDAITPRACTTLLALLLGGIATSRPLQQALHPPVCMKNIFQSGLFRSSLGMYDRKVRHNVHSFSLSNGTSFMFKSKKGLDTEVLASAIDHVMGLGVRPETWEHMSLLDPLRMLKNLQNGTGFHVVELQDQMQAPCNLCQEKHYRFLIMRKIPGLHNNFNIGRSRVPLIDANRTVNFVNRVASIFLLDSLLSFHDGRERANCFIDSQGLLYAIDYDTCQPLYRSNSTKGLNIPIIHCAQRQMGFYGKNIFCEVHEAMYKRAYQFLPHFQNALIARLQKPFWISCPFPVSLSSGFILKEGAVLDRKIKQSCISHFNPSLDYFKNPRFPWDAVQVINMTSLASKQQSTTHCVVDRPRILAAILHQRLSSIVKLASEKLSNQCKSNFPQ